MPAGRKPYTEPRIQWKLYLPATVASQVELLLFDPLREKIRHGARNELVEQLLREWLEKQKVSAETTE